MQVAPTLQKIVEAFDCNLVEGVVTHELKQFVIDGNKCVLNKPGPEAKVAEGTFEENEVYAIDVVVSTGEGKTRIIDEKETLVSCNSWPLELLSHQSWQRKKQQRKKHNRFLLAFAMLNM